ncbi:MAG: penicillin-binding protein 2, partial [Candidatus Thioglobus sp.]|nr:penicillin-binding protein 2 [Candidatus Thioglobus sp.]
MEKISNEVVENKIFSNRIILSIIFIIILTLVLTIRLYNLQITNHKHYAEEALGNQMRILPITPARGKIFDRNGKILATNQLAYKLTLTPEKTNDIGKTLQALQELNFINENDIKAFNKSRKRYKKFQNIPLKHKLSEVQVAEFLVSNQFVGVDIEPYFHRIYPHKNSSVHVVGYVSRMSKKDKLLYNKKNYLGTSFVGKIGIEKQYETLLHGNSGKKQIERNVTGRVIDTQIIKAGENGKDLYLSIDLDLQQKAEELLKGKRGAIVAVNVKNGEVLALVSTPTYNPNLFVSGISHKDYKILQASKNIPQLNRAIQGLYPPGSTIKPMVALAGMEEGVIHNHSKTFCPGYFKLPNVKRKFNDWKRSGHGSVTMQDSIAQSCDVFFYDLANKMGIDKMHDNLKFFNFGAITGIDIPGEQGGILPSKAWKKINKKEPWYRGETLISGIGQGFMSSTPLQLAVATAALANKGQLFQPKLLKNIHTPNQAAKPNTQSQSVQIPIKNIMSAINYCSNYKMSVKTYLGFDVGTKRTGVAIANSLSQQAS